MLSIRPHFVSALVLMLGSADALAESPLDRTRSLLETFQQVAVAPPGQTLTGDTLSRTRTAITRLDVLLDLERIARSAFAPHRAALGDPEANRLQKVFVQVVRLNAYRNAGDLLRRSQVNYAADVPGPLAAVVRANVQDAQDAESIEIRFEWALLAGVWRVTDVAFDGDSLVKDYQNQFGRILQKDGAAGLARKLDERLARELSERGPLP